MNYSITAWLEGAETEGAAPPRPSAWCPGPQATTVGKERASARSGQRCQGHHPGPHDTAAGEERAFARKGQQRQVHRPGPQASTAGRYGRPAGPGPRRPLSKTRSAAPLVQAEVGGARGTAGERAGGPRPLVHQPGAARRAPHRWRPPESPPDQETLGADPSSGS